MAIPNSYIPAGWRGTLPVHNGRIGLALNADSGEVIRLSLDIKSAQNIVETFTVNLDDKFRFVINFKSGITTTVYAFNAKQAEILAQAKQINAGGDYEIESIRREDAPEGS